jgi:hypothetical protein
MHHPTIKSVIALDAGYGFLKINLDEITYLQSEYYPRIIVGEYWGHINV